MTSASKALDQYFTPPKLAAELIEAVTVDSPLMVGDFAAGDGELLKAAVKRWPEIQCLAIDIDNKVIDKLADTQPDWLLACSDFLDDSERQTITVLKEREGTMPLIVLNPPFSCRGGTMLWTEIGGVKTHCSPALAFIARAIPYLQAGGQLVAIVPYGLIQGEKDEIARELLRTYYGFEVVKTYINGGFAKCSPRTAIIKLTAGRTNDNDYATSNSLIKSKNLPTTSFTSIQRGRVPNNKVNMEGLEDQIPFIHTTNLQNNRIVSVNRFAGHKFEKFRGPGVLLPRVGRPKIGKVVILEGEEEFVMSECLFLIECKSKKDAQLVYRCIIDNWLLLENNHGGTCATFLTIQSLKAFMQSFGFPVLNKKESIRTLTVIDDENLVKRSEKFLVQNWNRMINTDHVYSMQPQIILVK